MSILSRLLRRSNGPAVPSERADPVAQRIVAEAHAATELGRYAEALALVEPAFDANPNDAGLAFARANTLFAWGRLREAREAFDAMVARGLQHERLLLNLGWAYLEGGDVDAAAQRMEAAIAAH